MSQFEFIFVLISIIAGLALAQVLSGMSRPPRNSSGQLDIAHIAFSTAILVLLISIWWSTFRWEKYETWTISEFFLLCVYVSLFYAMATILNPPRAANAPVFAEIRTKFYAVHAIYCLLEPLVIYIRDGQLSPWHYVPMITHLFLLSILGIFLRKEMFDRLFSFWLIIVNVAWIFLARPTG
jgi:hypothetical protein